MKNLLKTITLLFLLSFLSCTEGYNTPQYGSNSNQGQTDNNEYYVKYIVSTYYPKIFSNVIYADVNGSGQFMNYSTRSWNVTIGPVKKGFRASVRNEKGSATNQIEVSKNGGPFALKASGENSASYTIDF